MIAPVPEGAEAQIILEKLESCDAGVVVLHVALDDVRMARTRDQLRFFAPDVEILMFPAWDCIPYDRVSPNIAIVSQRLRCLTRLLQEDDNPRIVLTTVNALHQRVLPRALLGEASFIAAVGDKINRDKLADFLVHNGYARVSTATESGEFATRGSIMDICPAGESMGYRLDFFGEDLESIRAYDTATQITNPQEKLARLELIPASEVLLNEESIARFRRNYRELFGSMARVADPLYEAISDRRKYAGMEHWLPLFYDQLETLCDYLEAPVVLLDHLVEAAYQERETMVQDSYATRNQAGELVKDELLYHPIKPEMLYIPEQEQYDALQQFQVSQLHPYAHPERERHQIHETSIRSIPDFHALSLQENKPAMVLLQDFLVSGDASDKKNGVMIACMSEGSRSRLNKLFREYDISVVMVSDWANFQSCEGKNTIGLALVPLEHGYQVEDLLVISEQDILGEKIYRSATKKKKIDNFMAELAHLEANELVVHKEHGIGQFIGLETMEVQGQKHDFLRLVYRDGDRLFVPVENLDLISRYGPASEHAELDKLGGLQWQQRTAKLKSRIRVTAEELVQIAAERAMKRALVLHPATEAYAQFCNRFPYSETDDQLQAIEDVAKDLASGKPMDRLICGDVGFGKTEIAMRAAFIASHPQKGEHKAQVAIVTPTTLLCRQHYENFKQRFQGFNVNIRMLSRMVSSKEQETVKEGLTSGDVDIVIGTHALLGKEVQFKRLGLMIVDEEQHFGVKQKERLKKLKANTHVLTLTATPIPRTLQLSLAGIRELSIIATPPVDRLAVRTYVMPEDPVILREAMLREHYRGGRSFYVCPRIKDLEQVEGKLKELVPELKVVAAHGQMPSETLDRIMHAFYDGAYDVLLSTTIIESGLDVPTANTLIVHRADMYGLAQLYQIRGRVGRSKLRAYAYLTLPPRHRPTKQALKRLDVMQKLDTLGAGFTLASHDMDIRGFGNLLGDEQSGHVREVGVELYQHMLNETIESIQAVDKEAGLKAAKVEFSAKVNLGIPVLIPESFVEDLPLRMALYRRIAYLETEEEVEAMASELIDRFGAPLPEEVMNLLSTVTVKRLCQQAGIVKVDAGPKGATLEFGEEALVAPDKLIAHVAAHPELFKFKSDRKLTVHGRDWQEKDARVAGIGEVIQGIVDVVGSDRVTA